MKDKNKIHEEENFKKVFGHPDYKDGYFKQRTAATPEPMSKPGIKDVLPEVIKDFNAREAVGIKKYGITLQTYNGRDALNDALQEAMDQVLYIKQEIMQRQDSFEQKIAEWANDRCLYESATPFSQMKKLFEETLEWYDEVGTGDTKKEMMELGDMKVVLTNIANSRGFSLEQCGWMAYNKIKDRTGHMENGTFVKDGDVANDMTYGKYEFCKSVGCTLLLNGKCNVEYDSHCIYRAKEFHNWMKDNEFKIVKAEG